MFRRQTGHIFGQLRQIAFPLLQNTSALAGLIGCLLQPRLMTFGRFGKFFCFPVQPRNGFTCIAV